MAGWRRGVGGRAGQSRERAGSTAVVPGAGRFNAHHESVDDAGPWAQNYRGDPGKPRGIVEYSRGTVFEGLKPGIERREWPKEDLNPRSG